MFGYTMKDMLFETKLFATAFTLYHYWLILSQSISKKMLVCYFSLHNES